VDVVERFEAGQESHEGDMERIIRLLSKASFLLQWQARRADCANYLIGLQWQWDTSPDKLDCLCWHGCEDGWWEASNSCFHGRLTIMTGGPRTEGRGLHSLLHMIQTLSSIVRRARILQSMQSSLISSLPRSDLRQTSTSR
jgi:hypothetical protein